MLVLTQELYYASRYIRKMNFHFITEASVNSWKFQPKFQVMTKKKNTRVMWLKMYIFWFGYQNPFPHIHLIELQ